MCMLVPYAIGEDWWHDETSRSFGSPLRRGRDRAVRAPGPLRAQLRVLALKTRARRRRKAQIPVRRRTARQLGCPHGVSLPAASDEVRPCEIRAMHLTQGPADPRCLRTMMSEGFRKSRPVRLSGLLCAICPISIARPVISAHVMGLERSPGLGHHVGLIGMARSIRTGHAKHTAGQQRFQVVATEKGAVCQSQLAHDVRHGARHVAEHHDLPRRFVKILQCGSLVSDQPPRSGVNLVSDQVAGRRADLCSGQVLLSRPSLVTPANLFAEMLGDDED